MELLRGGVFIPAVASVAYLGRDYRALVSGRRLLEKAKAATLFETRLAKPWRTKSIVGHLRCFSDEPGRKSSSAASQPVNYC